MNELHTKNKTITSSTRSASTRRNLRRARGFTLIEVLVALAIFTVLLVIIFVPLTQATRFLAIGRTRADLQQAANGTMSQLQRDLSRAIYVYPNDNLPGVTDQPPFLANTATAGGTEYFPYVRAGGTAGTRGVGNTSRIDILLPELDVNGGVKYPITPAKYIVTYYARRADLTRQYSPNDNGAVVLYRAQYPYLNENGNPANNVNVSSNSAPATGRYSTGAPNIGWLTHSDTLSNRNEINLEPFCMDATAGGGLVSGSHSLVTPQKVQLVAPSAIWPTPPVLPTTYSLKPNTTFNLADTNSDGKIDRVVVNLTLMNFNRQNRNDGGNDSSERIDNNVNFQRFTLSQTFNLPNIR